MLAAAGCVGHLSLQNLRFDLVSTWEHLSIGQLVPMI